MLRLDVLVLSQLFEYPVGETLSFEGFHTGFRGCIQYGRERTGEFISRESLFFDVFSERTKLGGDLIDGGLEPGRIGRSEGLEGRLEARPSNRLDGAGEGGGKQLRAAVKV